MTRFFPLFSFLVLIHATCTGPTIYAQAPQEKIYIHSDKNFYLAGEIVWFKLYVVGEKSRMPVSVSKVAYTELLDRNNKPVLQSKIRLSVEGGSGSFYLPLTINSDHYILRAYTNWMKNDGSRIYFEKMLTIVNTMKATPPVKVDEKPKADGDFIPVSGNLEENSESNQTANNIAVELRSNKAVYGIRQPVDISIVPDENFDTEGFNCSVSVYQMDSLQEAAGGWRGFQNINTQNRGPVFGFLPEYRGHFITGRVINTRSGNAVANANCLLTVPSVPYGLYSARSDSSGIVRFEVKDYYGPGEIIAQVEGPDKYRVDFFSPFSDDSSFLKLPAFLLSPGDSNIILQKSISMQAQNIYNVDSIRRFITPGMLDTLPFFGEAEYTYMLDNYKRFTTMEEVLREYVSPINVIFRNGKLAMSIFDQTTQQVYRENLLVLLDGVPLTEFDKIFSLDPLKIKRLTVVPRQYMLGSRLFFGIASFETYNGKFDGFDLDPSLIAVDYEGLQLQREFYSPCHENASAMSRIPDMRTTLYWNPVLTKSNLREKPVLKFYTSDVKGKFKVVLEGISKNGEPILGTTTFEVK